MSTPNRQPDPAMWHGNIPLSILFDPNASQNVKLVYVVLNAKAGASRWWNATHEAIALACGWKASSRKTVTVALAYLEEVGAIRMTKRINPANGHHAATRYEILDWHFIKTDWSPTCSSATLEDNDTGNSPDSQQGSATPPMWSTDTPNVAGQPQLTNAPTNVPTNTKSGFGSVEPDNNEPPINVIERLGPPPSLQGKTKEAQRKVVNDYISTPPPTVFGGQRKDWYEREARWHYRHGDDTLDKALMVLAWVFGVSKYRLFEVYEDWSYAAGSVQKAISGLNVNGHEGFLEAQSSTAVRWALARMAADGLLAEEEEFDACAFDDYVMDPEYRQTPEWPDVAKIGSAA